jgi:restriction system protein
LERALEEHLEFHWDETPFARSGVELARREVHGWPCRQVFTPVNAIDLLGFEPSARRWWVFELKRGRSADRVVGQVSRYLGWIGDERRGNHETVVGAIIVRKADPKLRYAVKSNERFSLWEFEDELAVRQVA